MKSIRNIFTGLFILVGFLCWFSFVHAQQTSFSNENFGLESLTDWQVMLAALATVDPVPFDSLPRNKLNQVISSGYWSMQHPGFPPYPGNFWNLDVWPLGDGRYVLDDRAVDYAALQALVDEAAALDSPSLMMRSSLMMSSLSSSYAYGNPVYLTNLVASAAGYQPLTASFDIAGGTNFVPYDILTTTNLLNKFTDWNWLGIGYTANHYTFSNQPVSQAFYMLAKPSKTMTVGFGDDSMAQCDMPFGLTNILQVAGGVGHSLALKKDGTVTAWGTNDWNQATVPTNLTGVVMIAAGWEFNVALLTNGTVTAWGGVNLFGERDVPANLTNVTVISAQAQHTLALRSDGTVVSWGYNTGWGETNVPVGLSNVTAIAAGFAHNLAVSNGWVVGWGYNGYGQCTVPPGLSNVVDVAAGLYHSLALLKNGTVVAWGGNSHGETNVPAGLTNVVTIVAGGDLFSGQLSAYSLALKSDGTVVAWGDGPVLNPVGGLNNVVAIGGGLQHALAVRTGPPTPVITLAPSDQYQLPGGNVTFTARGAGLYGVTYQWQTNGVNLSGATNAVLTLTNVQAAQLVNYAVVVTDKAGMGSITSSNAHLYFVTVPVITSQTLPTNQFVLAQTSLTLNATASAPGQFNGFPIALQWQFNGTNISLATSSNYTFTAVSSGTYSLIASNAVGSVSVAWQVNVIYPGGVLPWGSNSNSQLNASSQLTNVISIAAGKAHGIVALDSGTVTNWGSYWTGTNFVSVIAPPPLTNVVAVAAGSRHDVALKTDGTVTAWGWNDFGQTNVPANATNIIAIAAGGSQSLALKQDGTVLQWGQTNAPVPTGLTNVTAIASGTNFNLALLKNSTLVAWGANDYGQTNIPVNLSNVVAIAAGGSHALALKVDGTVTAWGAWTNVPAGLNNVMNVAAGENHSIALKNDGTVVCWGDNTFGQTNGVSGLNKVKLIAGGGDFTLAAQFSTLVMYPVDVSKDLLLIYNTNSADSATVLNYYLAHRPMVAGANVLGIGCTNIETIQPDAYTNVIAAQVQSWLGANPDKRPQYVILFPDIPSRVNVSSVNGNIFGPNWPSVQYQLATGCATSWRPFVTSINFNSTNDCIGYINKLAAMSTNSPGQLVISASAGGYANTNYVVDNVNSGYCSNPSVPLATNGLVAAGVSLAAIQFLTGCETATNILPHLTNAMNLAGYISWGSHSSLGGTYPYDGKVVWHGNSGWWIIRTVESFNGQRSTSQGNFLEWFASNAFGGTNYSNTPIGGPSYVDEPGVTATDDAIFFGLWAAGKNLAICAWNANNIPNLPSIPRTLYLQVLGDPFVTR